MKKRILAFILAFVLLVPLAACGPEPVKKQAVVEGSIFGGQNDDQIAVEAAFDTKWVTTGKNTAYNPELARFCALLCADSYFRQKDLDKGRQNRVLIDGNDADYTPTDMLTAFGFTETEHCESYLLTTDPTDSNDSVTLNLGHRIVDGKYDLYVVVIRGCFSWQEWCSAFDPGCTDAAYETLTGAHPDWTHKEYHKGTDVAANRAQDIIGAFVDEHDDDTLPDCVLLTGHSRGGAIANLLGARYEDAPDVRSYTYTFNAMPVAKIEGTENYKTIFNVFDENDFFTDPLPFGADGFSRYGTDMTLSAADSDEVLSAISALKGRSDYTAVPKDVCAEYHTLFAQCFPSSETLCDVRSVTLVYDGAESAAAGRETCLGLLGADGLGLDDLCTLGEIAEGADGKYTLTLEYNGFALLRAYAEILAYGSAACDAFTALFAPDEAACRLASLLVDNAAGINGGHLLVNSYAVAGMVK